MYYGIPFVTKALPADNPRAHSPSDHDCAVAVPLGGAGAEAKTRQCTVKTNRPILDSGIRIMHCRLALSWEKAGTIAMGFTGQETQSETLM